MNKYRITNPNNNKVRDCKSRTTEDNNTLFALDKNGKRVKSLSLGKSDIFSQLSKTKKIDGGKVSNAKGNNGNEMLKAFKFLADNTDVEWRTDKKEDGTYALGTAFGTYSPSSNQMGGYTDNDISSMIHSHPTNWGSMEKEMESMGWQKNSKNAFGGSDWAIQIKGYNNNQEKFKSQVYFKHSNNLYRVTPHKILSPRTITNSSQIKF